MNQDTALFLYYPNQNKFSINALIAALESDKNFDNLPLYLLETEQEITNQIETISNKHKKIIVGLSLCTTQLPAAEELLKNLKKLSCANILYLAGGPGPTGEPEKTLKIGFDAVAVGEGEETLLELLEHIVENKDYRNIHGIACFNDKQVYQCSSKRQSVDINKFPAQAAKNKIFGSIELTRGCPFFCKFCQTPYIFGAKMRHRSIENICRYLEIMKEQNLRDVRFIAPSAFSYGSYDGKRVNLPELKKLFETIKKTIGPKNRIFIGSFPSEVRPEQITRETLQLVLDYASNDNIIIGAQTGSMKMLDLCHRGHTVKDIYNAVELTLNAGIKANVDFISGLPGESAEDKKESEKVQRDLVKMGANIRPHTFMPLPQTPFYKQEVL